MYIPAQNFDEPQEQEIVCLMTGESYVYLEGNDLSLIDPKYHNGSIETLPGRFYKSHWVVNRGNGQIRVFFSPE